MQTLCNGQDDDEPTQDQLVEDGLLHWLMPVSVFIFFLVLLLRSGQLPLK